MCIKRRKKNEKERPHTCLLLTDSNWMNYFLHSSGAPSLFAGPQAWIGRRELDISRPWAVNVNLGNESTELSECRHHHMQERLTPLVSVLRKLLWCPNRRTQKKKWRRNMPCDLLRVWRKGKLEQRGREFKRERNTDSVKCLKISNMFVGKGPGWCKVPSMANVT